MSQIDLTDLPRITTVEIHEDNAGGLWLRPIGQGIVIEVPPNGAALADCRLYGSGWHASDSPEAVYPETAVLDRPEGHDQPRHIATYEAATDTLAVHDEHLIGRAGRRYLGIDPDGTPLAPGDSLDDNPQGGYDPDDLGNMDAEYDARDELDEPADGAWPGGGAPDIAHRQDAARRLKR